jgi:hypothetical protein
MGVIHTAYITLDRKLLNNWLWEEKPFSKGQAWIDLLFLMNFEDNTFPHGNQIITIQRGSRLTSIQKLADRWGWSRKKVYDFLKVMEKEQMIERKSNTKETLITVVKYDDYQLSGNTKETPKKHRRNTEETPKTTINKYNKELSNESIKTYSEIPALHEAILSFIEFRKGIKSPMTEHAIDLMIKELNKLSSDSQTQIAILNQSIMRGWKGIFVLKEDISKPQNSKPQQNKFNQYPQREYTPKDYEELERKLLNR